MTFQLSTSQTPSQVIKENYRLDRANCVGGFGTITDDGYGVSYMTCGEDTGRNYFTLKKRIIIMQCDY